jgi:hypothetical protein
MIVNPCAALGTAPPRTMIVSNHNRSCRPLIRSRSRWDFAGSARQFRVPREVLSRRQRGTTVCLICLEFSLIAEKHILHGSYGFPVWRFWECIRKLLPKRPFSARISNRRRQPRTFPCIFPSNQGINTRDGFAADCLLQRRVACELRAGLAFVTSTRHLGNRAKNEMTWLPRSRLRRTHSPAASTVDLKNVLRQIQSNRLNVEASEETVTPITNLCRTPVCFRKNPRCGEKVSRNHCFAAVVCVNTFTQ